ncbi:GatB/YqeY domain-containing protein [Aspergillus steynii IBT 23096]|uniref:Altered inheritance of mitochondria protein 41 n=1 Tax=Aspergillus steynii IBT 23096 TaxID=1392250 RepID=A0A2I2FZU0_9EURO|nr:GatB/YqeY domain-containing protein [Aspergillus steynii IBT 23096]PLB46148.1 GatB/YqeY domain-containing protein [Aspergillus steynii IBT 23096]
MFRSLRLAPRLPLRSVRWNSTASPASPPLMGKIRTDLKVAMRAKDKDRLNVLRALISETNNSVRTASPIQTDLQLLSLIRKRAANAKEASKQFAEAERPDLQENEDKQVAILEEYAGQVETMSLDDVKQIVSQEIAKLQEGGNKTNVGLVLKALFAPGGALDGKPAERSEVARIAKELVAAA